MTIEFRYGALCDDLEVQANRQGFTFGDKKEFVDSLRLAYNVGKFHFLTDKGQWATRSSRPNTLYGWDCDTLLVLNFNAIDLDSMETYKQ